MRPINNIANDKSFADNLSPVMGYMWMEGSHVKAKKKYQGEMREEVINMSQGLFRLFFYSFASPRHKMLFLSVCSYVCSLRFTRLFHNSHMPILSPSFIFSFSTNNI